MSDNQSTRRRFLGVAGAAVTTGLAGCASDGGQTEPTDATANDTTAGGTDSPTPAPENRMRGPREGDDLPPDPKPDDGYPPEFDEVPEQRSLTPESYDTLSRETTDGTTVEVPLIPIEDAYYMYARGEARFVDARSETGYDVQHVFGSVLSPAPDGRRSDPPSDWDEQAPVVTYCHCPHHLSSLRAADLLDSGFEQVYAIDEGFQAWLDRNYPLAGSDTNRDYTVRTVRGQTDASDAGETAWTIHAPTDQVEATEIESDGSYEMELKFVQVDADSVVQVETPSYTVEAPLKTVTSTTVTAETGETVAGNSTSGNSTSGNTTFGNSTDDNSTIDDSSDGNSSLGDGTDTNGTSDDGTGW
ncbi:rhodanese-like domain-containing protein [Salinirubrum litoreum]|uniref:Rhodanese-like domain-containing protein n=1 Tax=Salinirubrum litoreum TaxID=1126234 RepID=A0ABD5RCP5_9EURY|nr:rhodanese-like domain-containing protein [Salinirubrum litoreum]